MNQVRMWVLAAGIFGNAFSSALSDLAATLAPGSWRELQTSNISVLYQYSHNGHSLMYSDDITYDPTVEKFYYCGSDHCEPAQFFSFDEAKNSWEILPKPSWMPSWCSGVMHGYDHGAIDQASEIYYHRPFGGGSVHRYSSATKVWDQPAMTAVPSAYDVGNCCEALEFFPELGGLVWVRASGKVLLYSNNQWTQLATGLSLSGTYFIAEYNRFEKVLIFWSNGGGILYKLDRNRQVTQIQKPPVSFYDGSGLPGGLTVDPVGGRYLYFTPTQRQFYAYDVKADAWQLQSGTKPSLSNQGVILTSVDQYGIVFLTACAFTSCRVHVYKPPATAAEAAPVNVAPNAFKILGGLTATTFLFDLPESGHLSLSVYRPDGKLIARLFDGMAESGAHVRHWEHKNLSAGMVIVKMKAGVTAVAKKLVIVR